MKDEIRSNLLNGYIKFVFTTNMVFMLVGMVLLFFLSDIYGLYAASISAASALFNCIGLTLILRWHYSGVVFVVLASLLSAIALSITCAGWLSYSFGNIGVYIPYVVMVLYIGTLMLFLSVKHQGKSAWQQMDSSLDWAHFRHIYQLSAVVFLAILGIAYYEMPPNTNVRSTNGEDKEIVSNVSSSRLDSPDVTIEEVVAFEKKYNEEYAVDERDVSITKRIFALKHLLLSGLMPDIHNRDNLVNICMIHAGSFSVQQQEILDWYMALDGSQQAEWNICDKVATLSEFKDVVQNKIKRR